MAEPVSTTDTIGSKEPLVFSENGYQNGGWEALDACATPGSAKALLRRKRKAKRESLVDTLRSWVVDHQIGVSINLLLLLALTHICFPRARRRTRKFFELSYHNPTTGLYTKGPDDLLFVTYWIVIFTGLRAAVMTYLLLPAAKWAGVAKTKQQTRFAEQAWLFVYYLVFWSLGLYLMYNSAYWLNLRELWTHFPTSTMSYTLKWYYLVQFAFWLQQIVVVNIEERRKDHWQMFTHHIVTSVLMFTSYGYYNTKVGNVILVVMDVVDLVFPAAKMLKYAGYQRACDFMFAVFILTWFSARHVAYLTVCWSIYRHVPETMFYGCYSSTTGNMISSDGGEDILSNVMQPFLNPGGPVCFNRKIHSYFLGLLLFLQGITLVWFAMIVRVVVRVLQGNPADDSRSEDGGSEAEVESEGDEIDGEDEIEGRNDKDQLQQELSESARLRPQEQYVGVEELTFTRRLSPVTRFRKSGGHASGISIPGHSEPKELLGRIGCDKPS